MATEQTTDFGYLLRMARREAGLTQELLAERAGISTRAISDLERGINRAPRRDTLDMLAEALDLTPDERKQWQRARGMIARRTVPAATQDAGQDAVRLPAPLSTFVGRKREIDLVTGLVQGSETRLLTVTGPGGVGKTRLSLAVADRVAGDYPDGVWFVGLAPLNDHRHVMPTIAATLNINVSGDQPALLALTEVLAHKQTLLLLDNFEHVLKAALQIGELVRACPSLTVLATSRAPLQVQGEREYPLAPMSLPDIDDGQDVETLRQSEAVSLFVARAQAVRPDFELNAENGQAISMICHRLDGIPLAIELAAAHTRLLTPRAILPRLEHSLPLLSGGTLDLPVRQQTLRNTIAWSYDLLPADSQRLFHCLSVFRGGWTLEAVEAVSGEADVIRPLERLVEHSLVRVGEQSNGEPRYTMLEMIREFGLQQLAGSGEEHEARTRHGHYFLQLSEDAIPAWRRYTPEDPYTQLLAEHDNLRAALTWFMEHDQVTACRLSGALWRFFGLHGDVVEGRQWMQATLVRAPELPPAVRARVLEGIATMSYMMRDLDVMRSSLEEALPLFQEVGNRRGVAWVLHGFSRLAYDDTGDYPLAIEYCNQSLALYRELNDQVGIADNLNVLGIVADLSGDDRGTRQWYQESLDLRREVGDKFGITQSLRNLGLIAVKDGDYARAWSLFEESRAIGRTSNMQNVESEMLLHLARLRLREGDSRGAQALLTDSIRLFHQERGPFWIVHCLSTFVRIAAIDRDPVRIASLGGTIEMIVARNNLSPSPAKHLVDADLGNMLDEARGQVDAATWSTAWTRGRGMSLAEAVEYAAGSGQLPAN